MALNIGSLDFRKYINYLEVYDTDHSGRSLSQHLVETCIILDEWNRSEACVVAGLFHSIYNTKHNQSLIKSQPTRNVISCLIGCKAENLIFQFSSLDREELVSILERNDYSIYSKDDINDVVHIILANWIEQLPRTPKKIWFVEKDKLEMYLLHASPIAALSIYNRLKSMP